MCRMHHQDSPAGRDCIRIKQMSRLNTIAIHVVTVLVITIIYYYVLYDLRSLVLVYVIVGVEK